MKEYVGGFEVSVQDVLVVELLEGTTELIKNLQGLALSQLSLGFDVLCQSASAAVLIDKIVVVGSPQHLNKFDDIGMVYFRKDSDLVIRELTEFWCMLEFLNIHHLDRIEGRILLVFSLVDVAVLALAYLFDQNVVFNHLVH